jgi:predicted enzyme related to lactoylglutathione lyase
MKRVTGIGGVFFKAKDPKKLREWYGRHLGMDMEEWGAYFEWIDPANPHSTAKARTVWSAFDTDTDYFEPSQKPFMINYRVENLEGLLAQLREEGVTVVDKIETYPYGKFGWIVDAEGNKIELWEPSDDASQA